MSRFQPEIIHQQLGAAFYDKVEAASFPDAILRYRNQAAADKVGLGGLDDESWIAHFAHFRPLEGSFSQPLALRYHGHQFGSYNPEIGDGRGFLFAQMREAGTGRLLDLGTKGSGTTPYSRTADGKLTLKGAVREIMATEMLAALNVPTSQTFSVIETGEALMRHDEPSPTRSAVMIRLLNSHIRIGSFQRCAYLSDDKSTEALARHVVAHHYPNCDPHQDADTLYLALLTALIARVADMVGAWMVAGFVHGVMNTDNMNITGESFDYGPYRFLPTLRSDFTAAYFDHNGLYAFSRQPEAMYWNLGQLAQSLSLICDDKKLLKALENFAPAYRVALRNKVFERLQVQPKNNQKDFEFVSLTFKFLENSQCSWPQFWHDWQGGAGELMRAKRSLSSDLYSGDEFIDWYNSLKEFEVRGAPPKVNTPVSLLYEDIEAIWKPIEKDNNWSKFIEKTKSFQR